MQKALTQPLSTRALVTISLAILGAALLAFGGRSIYRRITHQPPTAAHVKAVIWDYLEEKSGQNDFKKNLPALTNAKPATVTRTNADGRIRVRVRKRDTADPLAGLNRQFRQEMTGANEYKTMYRLIGEQLAAADKLLASSEVSQQEAGILAAMEANRAAQHDAADAWLGARICEAYLWPYAEVADRSTSGKLNVETLLNVAEKAFRDAGETDNLIRNYRLIIRKTPKSNRADQVRLRLAKLFEGQQEFQEALKCLKEIQNTNNPALQPRMAMLEQRLQARK